MEEYFLSINEFADKLGVHPITVRRGISNGKISAINIGNGKKKIYRIPVSEIQRIAEFDLKEFMDKLHEKYYSNPA